MPVRVERDIVVTVPAIEPGTDASCFLELREAGHAGSVAIHVGRFGSEVSYQDLREALEQAEREFAPSLRSA
jgi:hypothetical protein